MKKKIFFLISVIIVVFTGCQSMTGLLKGIHPAGEQLREENLGKETEGKTGAIEQAQKTEASEETWDLSVSRPICREEEKKNPCAGLQELPLPYLDLPEPDSIYQRRFFSSPMKKAASHDYPLPVVKANALINSVNLSSLERRLEFEPKKLKQTRESKLPEKNVPAKLASKTKKKVSKTVIRNDEPIAPIVKDVVVEKESHRGIFARKGDYLEINLDGKGWIFLGSPDGKRLQGVSFISRDSTQAKTSFSFQADNFGKYELKFQLQDNSLGTSNIEVVHLSVVKDEEFTSLIAGGSNLIAAEPEDNTRYVHAERLFTLGEYRSALIEFLKDYREGNPYVNDRLAAIYAETGEHEAAVKFFKKNLLASKQYREKAVLGIVRSSSVLGDSALLLDYLESFLSLNSLSIENELLDAARFQLKNGRYGLVLNLLDEYRSRYVINLDEVYFMLACLYEQDSSYRDLLKSRDFYQKVYDEYPESVHAEESYRRTRYLDRYFFHIR